jgi:HD-GYP domain-containing protein (c-di-GMP phosphodiesterase class II)/CHASE2 domain-containing sensor protein
VIELSRHLYNRLRDKWYLPWWALWLLLSFCVASGMSGWFQPWLLRQVELKTYDVNARSLVSAPSPRILLVIVGERSLSSLGAWPFARRLHSELLSRLTQARVVGFDILFAESTKDDVLFAKAIAQHRRVVLAAHTAALSNTENAGQFAVEPVPMLLDAAADIGFTNVEKDIDGLLRYARPIRTAGSNVLPSLAFALVRQMLQEEGKITGDKRGITIAFGKHAVRLNGQAQLWFIPTVQGPPVFEYVDVLEGRVPPETFRDAVVIVGAAASGAADFQIIPDGLDTQVISGVRYNAEELRALLTGESVQMAPSWLNALAAMFLALLAGLSMSFMRPLRGGAFILTLCFLWLILVWLLLTHQLFWITGSTPVLAAIGSGTLMLLARQVFLHESWRTQSISLDNIVYLNAEEANRHTSLEQYLQNLWVRVGEETGIRFLGGPMSYSELPEEFIQSTPGGNGVLILAGRAKQHRMAVPLHTGAETKYGLFGWNRRIDVANARAAAALAISAAWLFQAQDEGRHRHKMLMDTIKAVFTALDYRDPITGGHSTRVSELSLHTMESLNLPQQLVEDVHLGALIHDLGKIGIPDYILNKQGKLSSDEFEIIRNHPNIARNILSSVDLPQAALEAVLQHHERYDGSGYPQGLRGKEISLAGRIVAIADVFDAMSHNRPYRNGQSLDEVLQLMSNEAGSHFDLELLEIFVDMVRRFPPHA